MTPTSGMEASPSTSLEKRPYPEMPKPEGAMDFDDGPYQGPGAELSHMQGARVTRTVDAFTADQMRTYVDADRAQRVVPQGFAVVPQEPTPEMIEAGANEWCRHNHGEPYDAEIPAIYAAFLAASPKPLSGVPVEVGEPSRETKDGPLYETTVALGPVALEFTSHQQWVDKAQSWFRNLAATNFKAAQKRYIALDAAGRVCMNGGDFARARDEGAFPVRVHLIDAAATQHKDAPPVDASMDAGGKG